MVVRAAAPPEALPTAGVRSAEFLPCDVRDADAVQALVAAIVQRHGRLDVLVHNAGGSPPVDAATVSPRFHEGVIRLNLTAALRMAQAANAAMQTQAGGGVIVFIGSVSALRPSPGTAAYGAAKAAVLSLASSLAVESGAQGARGGRQPRAGAHRAIAFAFWRRGGHCRRRRHDPRWPHGRAFPTSPRPVCTWPRPRAAYLSGTDLLLRSGGEKPAFLAAAQAHLS